MKKLLFLLVWASLLFADMVSVNIAPSLIDHCFMKIKILDQKQLSFKHINSVKFSELSDLAYDQKTKTLYMVGDKGSLFAFDSKFTKKIEKLMPLRATKLKTKKGKRLKKWKRDSEGLVLDKKGRLYISFEGDHKVGWFHKNSAEFGAMIKKYKIPKELRETKNYRSRNKSLEALAWHAKYGLLTATEFPLKRYDKKRHVIYALKGKKWYFKAEAEENSAIVAMEVMDDGNLLIMERSYAGILSPFVITLKKVYLDRSKNGWCQTKVLAKMNSHQGWSVDNFEGLAKVGKHRYVMISDDNENFFQKTLLIYFEVLEA
jgi:hypothetical protein